MLDLGQESNELPPPPEIITDPKVSFSILGGKSTFCLKLYGKDGKHSINKREHGGELCWNAMPTQSC